MAAYEPCPLVSVPSVGAAVLTEPLLQRGLLEDPLQKPVEPAAGQPLPDPVYSGRQAQPRREGATYSQHRETSLKSFFSLILTCINEWVVEFFQEHSAFHRQTHLELPSTMVRYCLDIEAGLEGHSSGD